MISSAREESQGLKGGLIANTAIAAGIGKAQPAAPTLPDTVRLRPGQSLPDKASQGGPAPSDKAM